LADKTRIEWTEATWNPIRGCSKVSPGCLNCYAEKFAERWRGIPGHPYEQGFDIRIVPDKLELPLRWKKPRLILVNSMSDLFHEDISLDYIKQVFSTMNNADHHIFQVLTKRDERLNKIYSRVTWSSNIWIGVSIENQDYVQRIEALRNIPSEVKFISFEPLLGPIEIDLTGINWVIVGGESGPNARPIKQEWVCSIRDKCLESSVPFFFKQWGGKRKHLTGRILEGKTWNEMPVGKRK